MAGNNFHKNIQHQLSRLFFQPKNGNIFLIFLQKYKLWCSLEASHWDASNEYLQHMFLRRNKKLAISTAFLTRTMVYIYMSSSRWHWIITLLKVLLNEHKISNNRSYSTVGMQLCSSQNTFRVFTFSCKQNCIITSIPWLIDMKMQKLFINYNAFF